MTFTVVWEIDIDNAETPREAAELARNHQTAPGTSAVVFTVLDEDGNSHHIDLLDNEE